MHQNYITFTFNCLICKPTLLKPVDSESIWPVSEHKGTGENKLQCVDGWSSRRGLRRKAWTYLIYPLLHGSISSLSHLPMSTQTHAHTHKRSNTHCESNVSISVVIAGIHYRKSCASSGACLIASSGYQQFCTGKLNSVCITCCNTPLCNGPRQKKRPLPSTASTLSQSHCPVLPLSVLFVISLTLCWQTLRHWVRCVMQMYKELRWDKTRTGTGFAETLKKAHTDMYILKKWRRHALYLLPESPGFSLQLASRI